MKFNMKFILPYLLIFSNQIGKGKTQTDEQLNSFKYGAEEFRLAIIGDRYIIINKISKLKF